MQDIKDTELKRWRLYVILVTVLGIILFSLPWITPRYKIALTVPLYAMFVYVYYKYLTLKKGFQAAAAEEESKPAGRKIPPGQKTAGKPTGKTAGKTSGNQTGKQAQKGNAALKKGR